MRSMLLIAGKDLRLRIRDRSAFMIGLVVPFVLALVFSLILGGGDFAGPLTLDFGVVDADRSAVSQSFVDVLDEIEREGLIAVVPLQDTATGRELVQAGDINALFVIPAGFGDAVERGQGALIEVVGNVDRPTSASVAESIASAFTAGVEGTRLVVLTGARVGADAGIIMEQLRSAPPAASLVSIDAADRRLDPTTFFVAGMSVFFLFFTVQFGVTSLLEEKREGTMSRLLAAPIGRWAIVGAKAVVSIVLGVTSMAVLVIVSTLLLGAEWGDPIGVAALVVSGVLSAVGIMAVVAAFARTPEGAGNLQAVIAVGMGMLGGIFFPTPLGDGLLGRLSLLTPHRWFMSGLADLAGGGGLAVVLPAVGALLAFGIVTTAVAGARLRKAVLV